MARLQFTALTLTLYLGVLGSTQAAYFGKLIGRNWGSTLYGVAGSVYAMDEKTIQIIGFSYTGGAPDAFFYLEGGERGAMTIPNERGSVAPLGSYNNADIVLALPEGTKITDYTSFSVWCRRFNLFLGRINIPQEFMAPKPQTLGPIITRSRYLRTSGPVVVLDHKTVQITNFNYDGRAPAAYFYAGNTMEISSQASPYGKISKVLRAYDGETVKITLPEEGISFTEVKWLSVWCERFSIDFGHIRFPENLNVPVHRPAV